MIYDEYDSNFDKDYKLIKKSTPLIERIMFTTACVLSASLSLVMLYLIFKS